MNDVLRALAIAAGILAPIVILTVIVSIAVVRRAEGRHGDAGVKIPDDSAGVEVKQAAVSAPPKTTKAAAPTSDEISVIHILLFGIGLFTLTVVALLGLSVVQHLR